MAETPHFKKIVGVSRINDVIDLMFTVINDCEDHQSKDAAQLVLNAL